MTSFKADEIEGQLLTSDAKESVRVATTGNISLSSAPASIDSISLNSGDRVLAKDQTAQADRGIYVFDSAGNPMSRSNDFSTGTGDATCGARVYVCEGTTNEKTTWTLTTIDPITVGTTSLTFENLAGAGSGDVVGPASSTDHGIARFDGATGKLLQNSTYTLSDAGDCTIKLDNFGAPDDNTDLNATTSAHGLCPKGSASATEFLNGNLAWATPAGGSGVDRYPILIDNHQRQETSTSYQTHITFDAIFDSDKAPTGIRIVGTLWRSGGSGTVYAKLTIGSDSVELSTSSTSTNNVVAGEDTSIASGTDTVLSGTVELKVGTSGTCIFKHCWIYFLF